MQIKRAWCSECRWWCEDTDGNEVWQAGEYHQYNEDRGEGHGPVYLYPSGSTIEDMTRILATVQDAMAAPIMMKSHE